MSLESPHVVARFDDGSKEVLPELTCKLPGGLIGHYQRTLIECKRAAVATILQCPYEDVPPTGEIADQEAAIQEFVGRLGLELIPVDPRGTEPPLAPPDGLWGGTTTNLAEADYTAAHVVVCRGRELIFDPALGWCGPNGEENTRITYPDEIVGGFQFVEKGTF
jgi:hypothetical protein